MAGLEKFDGGECQGYPGAEGTPRLLESVGKGNIEKVAIVGRESGSERVELFDTGVNFAFEEMERLGGSEALASASNP